MYGIAYRMNGLHGFADSYALFCWNFPWSIRINVAEFYWYSIQLSPSKYSGRELVGVNFKIGKPQEKIQLR